MHSRLIKAGVSVMALWTSVAQAEQAPATLSGASLIEACDAQDASQNAYCVGYIGGVADVVLNSGRRSPVTACIPQSASKDQIFNTTVEYLHDHPREVRSYSGAVLVLEAIRKAFRCH